MFSKRAYTCLEQRIGVNQGLSDCPPRLASFLTESQSGMYLNDFSPFARTDYIQDIAPNYSQAQTAGFMALPVWTPFATWQPNVRVRDEVGEWSAKVFVPPNEAPSFDSPLWRFERFAPNVNGFLAEIRRRACKMVLQKVFEDKTARGLTKTLIQERALFTGIGNPTNTEPKSGRFVGIEIQPRNWEGVRVSISRLGLQTSGAAQLPFGISTGLYLYHRSQTEPIINDIGAIQGSGLSFQWTTPDTRIDLFGDNLIQSPGESYLLGYYEDGLPDSVFAVNKTVSEGHCWFSRPCLTCGSREDYLFWERYSGYVGISPFYINSEFLNGESLPTLGFADSNIVRTPGKTYGLNLFISVACELDSFICRNANILDRAIGLQAVILLMEEALANIRINRTQSKAYDYAAREKEAPEGVTSVYKELQQAYDAVSFDYSDFKSPCLPCDNKPGVFTRTI